MVVLLGHGDSIRAKVRVGLGWWWRGVVMVVLRTGRRVLQEGQHVIVLRSLSNSWHSHGGRGGGLAHTAQVLRVRVHVGGVRGCRLLGGRLAVVWVLLLKG